MKILHLNTTDIQGGAARAAYRLNKGLQSINLDSKMLVQKKSSDDNTVFEFDSKLNKVMRILRSKIDSLPLKCYKERKKFTWSVSFVGKNIKNKINNLSPDIINLHWINDGFLNIRGFKKLNKPIVWTLHDMWAFTGGCHYAFDCEKYKEKCGKCPQLISKKNNDLSRKILKYKFKSWREINLTIATPSKWLARCAKESSLFKHKKIVVIPNGLDINVYKN